MISSEFGDTSGRFGVAETIARVFPSHMAFVKKVVTEGIAPASSFPSGPFPKDKLTYRSDDIVEFQTPAHTEGLGTQSRLQKDGYAIRGVALLHGKEPNLIQLSVRFSPDTGDLAAVIIRQVGRDALHVRD